MSVVHKCDQSQLTERPIVHHVTGNSLKFSILKSTLILTMNCLLHHPLDLVNKHRLALIRISCPTFHLLSLKDHRHQLVKETPIILGISYPASSVCSEPVLGKEAKKHLGDHLHPFTGNPLLRKEMVNPRIQIVRECEPTLLISETLVEV